MKFLSRKNISNTIAFNKIPKTVKYTKYYPYQLSLLPVSYIKYLKLKKIPSSIIPKLLKIVRKKLLN